MRVILDTNVFVSGIFFTGPSYRILDAWRKGELTLVVSPSILEEYRRVGQELAEQFEGVAEVQHAPSLEAMPPRRLRQPDRCGAILAKLGNLRLCCLPSPASSRV